MRPGTLLPRIKYLALASIVLVVGSPHIRAFEGEPLASIVSMLRITLFGFPPATEPGPFVAGPAEVTDTSDCLRQEEDPSVARLGLEDVCTLRVRIANVMASTIPEECRPGSACDILILSGKGNHADSDRVGEKFLTIAV